MNLTCVDQTLHVYNNGVKNILPITSVIPPSKHPFICFVTSKNHARSNPLPPLGCGTVACLRVGGISLTALCAIVTLSHAPYAHWVPTVFRHCLAPVGNGSTMALNGHGKKQKSLLESTTLAAPVQVTSIPLTLGLICASHQAEHRTAFLTYT